MRYFFLAFLLATVLVIGIGGFRGDKFTQPPLQVFPDMDEQAKVRPQSTNDFFSDGTGARKPVAGTVPMGLSIPDKMAAGGGYASYGFSHGGDFYNTGKIGDYWGDGFPEEVEITPAFLRLGRERYDVNCAICHGVSGNGAGVMGKYGIANIANFHTPGFMDVSAPDYRSTGSIFDTITRGKGLMGSYGHNIPVKERWAIIAWIRTLQLSRNAPLTDEAVQAAWSRLSGKSAPTPAPAPESTPAS